jgi:hypothetical protein
MSEHLDPERPPSWRQRWREFRAGRAKERAIRQLRLAIREAGDELSLEWVRSDRDFDEVRLTPEWQDLLRHLPDEERRSRRPLRGVAMESAPLPVPARPWGSPGRRIVRNVVAASLSIAALLWATEASPGGWVLVVAVLTIVAWRIGYLTWEKYVDTSKDLLPPPPVEHVDGGGELARRARP